mmetsp:Transcript_73017/g.136381  ORF Transcript_73017/g.136381 Transcript_73017/m.136381 type:complete len:523 (-) Transcript_73017:17-1585(-)
MERASDVAVTRGTSAARLTPRQDDGSWLQGPPGDLGARLPDKPLPAHQASGPSSSPATKPTHQSRPAVALEKPASGTRELKRAASAETKPQTPRATSADAKASPRRPESTEAAPAAKRAKTGDNDIMAGWRSLLERTRRHPQYATEYTQMFKLEGADWPKTKPVANAKIVLGVDCEMVYTKEDPNACARVTVVGMAKTLLDLYIETPADTVLDYRTSISGIKPPQLLKENGALPFEVVQQKVLEKISPDTILVGHALQNDLRALRICHSKIVDTALLFAVEGKTTVHKHKLHSLVTLMKPKVATLKSANLTGAHDSRQDAEWAMQIALYEASIHPRITGALKLESFPTQVFLSEIPKGTTSTELQSLFRGGSLGELSFQLQGESPPEWLGRSIMTFANKATRDAAVAALPRYVYVHIGPLHDWAGRRDVSRMQNELIVHFSQYGRVKGCKVFRPNAARGQLVAPVANIICHPATARALLTNEDAHRFGSHWSTFPVRLMDEEAAKQRCIVPLRSGHFIAKIQ